MVAQVGEEQCLACHNDQSPTVESFDYETMKDEGLHELFPLKYEH